MAASSSSSSEKSTEIALAAALKQHKLHLVEHWCEKIKFALIDRVRASATFEAPEDFAYEDMEWMHRVLAPRLQAMGLETIREGESRFIVRLPVPPAPATGRQ